ncbi:MAG: DUF89 family protein, partial [Nitrospiraceae bacterium]|nr:DUF89 family protein [Nitrospiraceae bacterium]
MKATLDCLVCFLEQALRAGRVATDDPKIQHKIVNEIAHIIPTLDLEVSPAEMSQPIYELTASLTGCQDPYEELKSAQNEAALELEPELRAMIDGAPDRLDAALHLAAAGNVIDLGVREHADIDVRATIRHAMEEGFAVDHTPAFRESLARSSDLLYLLDNAGEIVFDKILIEELCKHTRVTAALKAAPIINDALIADAEQVGLTGVCEVIDNGGAFVGNPLSLVSEPFLERMRQANMIVGKGQGNYETVDVFPGDVFLILKAKCPVIADHMGVQLGQVALISTQVR